MPNFRQDRINEEVLKELSYIVRELKDPRIPPLLSVVAVDVAKDLKTAKVYVSCFEGDEALKEAVKGLKSAEGFIKKELSAKIRLRAIPQLIFIADHSISHGNKISKILKELDISEEDTDE